MSVQMRDPFPVFSVAQRRPNSKGSVASFNEELFKYVEDFTARMQVSKSSSESSADIIYRKSDTVCTEVVDHRSSSPRVSYTTVDSGVVSSSNTDDNQYSVAQTSGQSASLQEGMMHSPPLFMSNQVYNLHYPGGSPFVSMPGPYVRPQMVEAGLLPMSNAYTAVVPVTTNVLTDSLSEIRTTQSAPTTKPQP